MAIASGLFTRRHLGTVLFLIACFVSIICPLKASAQVTGTFFPTALGDLQEPGRTPYPQLVPTEGPYARQQIMQLEKEVLLQRRPYVNLTTSYANQSLIAPPGQMDSFTPEAAEFGFFPTLQSEVRLSYIPTIFGLHGLHGPNVFGTEYRGAFRYQPTNRLRLWGQLGLFQFAKTRKVNGGLNVIGNFLGQYAITDHLRFTSGFRRDVLGASLLATTGLNLPQTNELVGRVTQNLFFGLLEYQPTRKTGLGLSFGGGFEQGTHVRTNPFMQFGLTAGHTFYQSDVRSHLSFVNLTYQLLEFNWKYNLSNIGNAELQVESLPAPQALPILRSSLLRQTQIPAKNQPGVGGYFSPQEFWIHSLGLGLGGKLIGPVYYRGGAGVGMGYSQQQFVNHERLSNPGWGPFGTAAVTARLDRRTVAEVGWIFFQSQTVYRRTVLYTQCRHYF